MEALMAEIEETIRKTRCRAREIARAAKITDASLCGIRKGRQKHVFESTAVRIRAALAFIRIKYGLEKETKDGQ